MQGIILAAGRGSRMQGLTARPKAMLPVVGLPIVARIVEKPALADAPSHIGSLALYAFDLVLLDYLQRVKTSARGEMELQTAIQMIITEHGALPVVMTDWRWELTIPTDLLELNLWWLQEYFQLDMTFIETDVDVPNDAKIETGVYIEAGATIGAGARLRDGVVSAGENVSDALISEAIEVK